MWRGVVGNGGLWLLVFSFLLPETPTLPINIVTYVFTLFLATFDWWKQLYTSKIYFI